MIDLTGRAVLLERSEIDLRTVNLSSCASAPSPSSRVPPVRPGQRVPRAGFKVACLLREMDFGLLHH